MILVIGILIFVLSGFVAGAVLAFAKRRAATAERALAAAEVVSGVANIVLGKQATAL